MHVNIFLFFSDIESKSNYMSVTDNHFFAREGQYYERKQCK